MLMTGSCTTAQLINLLLSKFYRSCDWIIIDEHVAIVCEVVWKLSGSEYSQRIANKHERFQVFIIFLFMPVNFSIC
jgi:hypothetical protein